MRSKITFLAILIFALLASNPIESQSTVEAHEKPIAAQILAGIVRVGTGGEGAKGVKVERCTRNWKRVESSTTTDENGRFELPLVKKGTYYLRFSAPGLTTTLIKVKIRKSAPKEVLVMIPFAT